VIWKRACWGVCLTLTVLLAAACSRGVPESVEVVVTVPVIETRVVEVVREVEKTVVVTATPEPTPAYESPLNAPAGTLVYPLSSEPVTLDPQQASDETSQLVVQQLYEGLYNLRGDGSPVAAAATDLVSSSDGTVYTVTLRSGLTWSDGSPLTAQHYVDGVCRVLAPEVGNPAYYLLTDIAPVVNARGYAGGDLADCSQVGIRAADEVTLVITLERPAAFFPRLLAAPLFFPAPPAASVAMTDTLPAAPLTNGPYLLAEQAPGDHLTLTRNPRYWNAGQVSIERVEFRIVPDLAGQLALYERGDLAVSGLPSADTPRIQADPAWARELQLLLQPGVSYLALNTQVAPTNDANVRRAIASALDRQYLVEQVLQQPWHLPAYALIPPQIPGYAGDGAGDAYRFDPEAAQRTLAEAGYGPANPVPPVELWYNREGNNEALFKAVAGMLEAVGIPVRLLTSEWNVYLDGLENCNRPVQADAAKSPAECSYHLYRMGWVMDYPDAASMLATFRPGSRFQYTGWESAEYTDLLGRALAEPNDALRADLYAQAERVILQAAVIIPLQYYDRTVLVKDGIRHDYPPFGPPNLQYWELRGP
jgi:oligopeptide transport system substrate-binding protein